MARSILTVGAEFDKLRFSESGIPVDRGTIIERPRGPKDKLIIRIETGIAAGCEAFALSEDFPGDPKERVLFFTKTYVKMPLSFRLHIVNTVGIRVRPLPL